MPMFFSNLCKIILISLTCLALFACGSNGSENNDNRTPESGITLKAVVGDKHVVLSWNVVDDVDSYDIHQAKESFGALSVDNYNTLTDYQKHSSITKHSTTITGLTNNSTYHFIVTATKDSSKTLFSNVVTAIPVLKAFNLNDTGITWGGNFSSGNQSFNHCSPTGFSTATVQDCHIGRDAQAVAGTLSKVGGGNAGFDFSKLSSVGTVLAIQNSTWSNSGSESAGTQWSCVRDNHTGLVWEVKTDDNGIHDKDNTYRWGGKTAIGKEHASKEGTYYSDWDNLVDGSNNAALCGFSNWRVPTKEELRSIVDYGRKDPSIDNHYFPNTSPSRSFWWSASPFDLLISDNNSAWYLNFSSGDDRFNDRKKEYHVRLVRSSQSVSLGPSATAPTGSEQTIKSYVNNEWQDSRYTLHNDGTVTDKATKLMWKVCSEGQNWSDTNGSVSCSSTTTTTYSWKGALEHVNSYTFAGHSDWRVPNIKELNSLVALDRYKPSINLSIFPNTPAKWFWSASPSLTSSHKGYAWRLGFELGNDSHGDRTLDNLLRLVRSNQ